jgi:superfamily I DNA/RNA helicase
MTQFKPSPYQLAIYNFIEKSSGNAVISAVAGSGKTTTIVEALKLIPKTMSVIFIAFNKSIVAELKWRVPDFVDVSTVHSVGWGATRQRYPKSRIDDKKVYYFLREISSMWEELELMDDEEERQEYINRVRKLIDLARLNLISDVKILEDMAEKHSIDITNGECKKALDCVRALTTKTDTFDFVDMLYIPAIKKLPMLETYDWVFVDECQDLNVAQQEIFKMLMKQGSRFVAVGDLSQSIYGFCGADIESFNKLKNMPNTIELPLSVSYRCGKRIIEKAQEIVPHITYPETAKDGEVRYDGKTEEIMEGDMVLCRNTAPLVMLCLKMLATGKKAMILGGDIGKSLIAMVNKTKQRDINQMFERLSKQRGFLIQQICKRKRLEEAEAIQERAVVMFDEKVKVFEIICNEQGIKTTETLVKRLNELFSDDRKGVVCSTIHKAKGLECSTVHIICRELMPSSYAKKEWEKAQEDNLMYVAYTRAKDRLIFISDFEYKTNDN